MGISASRLHYGDLSDSTNLIRIVRETQPDEIYNLGAMSHVKVSFDAPEYTANADGIRYAAVTRSYPHPEIRAKNQDIPGVHVRSLYGLVQEVPQNERTPFYQESLCCSQTIRILDHGKLPGGLQTFCLQWHTI